MTSNSSSSARQEFLKKLTGLNMGEVERTAGSVSSLQGTPMTPGTPGGSRIPWTTEEDDILREAVARHKGKNWKCVASALPNRTRAQCAHRWQKVLNPTIKKGAWSPEEDEMLQQALQRYGCGKWSRVSCLVPGRNGKQCRERWHNHLKPDVNKEPWSAEEDELIVKLRGELGNKWAAIARELPGRTENAVKNRWNAKLALDCGAVSHGTPRAFSKGFSRSTPRAHASRQSSAGSVSSFVDGAPVVPASLLSSSSMSGMDSSFSNASSAGSQTSAAATAAAIAAAAAKAASMPTAAALAAFSSGNAAVFANASDSSSMLGQKRTNSLMSLISQLSGASASAPATPLTGDDASMSARKRLKVETLPTVGPLPSINLDFLSTFQQQQQLSQQQQQLSQLSQHSQQQQQQQPMLTTSSSSEMTKFDLLNPHTFTLGTFQKTQLAVNTPSPVHAPSAPEGNPSNILSNALSDLDWLASIASAQAVAAAAGAGNNNSSSNNNDSSNNTIPTTAST